MHDAGELALGRHGPDRFVKSRPPVLNGDHRLVRGVERGLQAGQLEVLLAQPGVSSEDRASGIATDANGNVYATGTTRGDLEGTNAGGRDVVIRSYGR